MNINIQKINLELLKVNPQNNNHVRNLFIILARKKFHISHISLPTYKEHKNFVENHPYRFWYFILNDEKYIGVIYVTFENVIGINTIISSKELYINAIEAIINTHKPLEEIKSVRNKFFVINVNPNNKTLIEAIKLIGLSHIQNTYILKNKFK